MRKTCETCVVRDRALCSALSPDQLAVLSSLGTQRHLKRGETLVRAGDETIVCANLQTGVMKIAATTSDGEAAIVGLLYPGDFIGRPFAGSAGHDIVALTDVMLCSFSRVRFEEALRDHQQMESLLLQRTMAELDRAREWLVKMGRANAGARVAGFLDDLTRRLDMLGCTGPQALELPLSRGEIAELLGLTIETVSRQFTRMRVAGAIELPGGRRIIVRDAQMLKAMAAA
ncbi:Crp/Fnr family transcriptional regulator [Polymorphobacter sp.]|uniref:Crp/Fnr family transcriptional regulator n=1 Tax=Polymorphobacter sp. TaxID=1909290 RepID=UPI003F71CC9B